MNDTVLTALQITLVGMGLVFALICALWAGMALLMRLGADRVPAEEPLPPAEAPAELVAAAALERVARRRAAVAAVAVVLAEQSAQAAHALPTPPTAAVSPWQAVARGNQLRARGRVRR